MSGKNLLIATFPVENGLGIRAIVTRHNRLFYHKKWEREGNLGKFIGDLSRPDSEDEGSRIRFRYDVDEVGIEMEKLGASVEMVTPEFAA